MSRLEPTLETERLRLRPMIAEDLEDDHAAVGSDPAVTWQRQAITLDDSRAALANRIRHWELHGFGMFAVHDKADDRFLGHAGLQHLEDTEDIELGYYLARTTWGRGIATEAARECVRYAREDLELTRLVAVVRPDNDASQRVLSKLDFRHDHDGHHYGVPVQVWTLDL